MDPVDGADRHDKTRSTTGTFCVTIEIYRIKTAHSGGLFVMPAPRVGPLREFVKSVRGHGVDEIISLLAADDIDALGLQDEQHACHAEGLAFTNFAIPDFGRPDPSAFSALVARVAGDLESGRGVAVHCRAGIGRAGMLACCVLKHFGQSGEEAIARVSQARQHAVPDNLLQRDFIMSYAPPGGTGDGGL